MSYWEMTLPTTSEIVMKFKADPTATAPELKWVGSPITTHSQTTSSTTTWAADIEAMLKRYEKNGRTKTWPHRQIADHLKALGFEPSTAATGDRPYIRWYVHATNRAVTLYQEGSGLVVDSKPLLPFALTLPGAKKPKGKHPKIKWKYGASLDHALGAAAGIRKHADE
jgi:hypothetical protein